MMMMMMMYYEEEVAHSYFRMFQVYVYANTIQRKMSEYECMYLYENGGEWR